MAVYISGVASVAASDAAALTHGLQDPQRKKICLLRDKVVDLRSSPEESIRRRQGKVDRFSALILNLTFQLARTANQHFDHDRIGVVVGNMLGGWQFGERELETLHREGVARMSAYQATAWFPAAAQGEVSIAHDFKGYSKTMSGGLACGLQALLVACDAIELGRASAVIAGSAESLASKFSVTGVSDIDSEAIAEAGCFFLLTNRPLSLDARKLTITVCGEPNAPNRSIVEQENGRSTDLGQHQPFFLGVHPLLRLAAKAGEKEVPAMWSFRTAGNLFECAIS